MLFQHTLIEKITSGQKTQTRRLFHDELLSDKGELLTLATNPNATKHRIKYAVGRDYSVCPGRGKPGLIIDDKPLRILVTAIRFEDVRNITDQDARAEGFENALEFWCVWTSIYLRSTIYRPSATTETTREFLKTLDDAPFKAWAITFRVAE